eukprot:5700826-Pleurochrysis_carterae.AAC.1
MGRKCVRSSGARDHTQQMTELPRLSHSRSVRASAKCGWRSLDSPRDRERRKPEHTEHLNISFSFEVWIRENHYFTWRCVDLCEIKPSRAP